MLNSYIWNDIVKYLDVIDLLVMPSISDQFVMARNKMLTKQHFIKPNELIILNELTTVQLHTIINTSIYQNWTKYFRMCMIILTKNKDDLEKTNIYKNVMILATKLNRIEILTNCIFQPVESWYTCYLIAQHPQTIIYCKHQANRIDSSIKICEFHDMFMLNDDVMITKTRCCKPPENNMGHNKRCQNYGIMCRKPNKTRIVSHLVGYLISDYVSRGKEWHPYIY
jgi:hypothetical protein